VDVYTSEVVGARGAPPPFQVFDGLEVVVRVRTGALVQTQSLGSQSSYLSQNALEAHFGLGAATHADAVDAAVACQRALAAHVWPQGTTVRARVGIHTGEPRLEEEGYLGLDVVRASRVCAAAHGGQIVITAATRELVRGNEPDGVEVRELGDYALKDIAQPERVFELEVAGLATGHPELRAESAGTAEILGGDWRRQLDKALDALGDGTGGGWEQRLEHALEQIGADVTNDGASRSVSWNPPRSIKIGAVTIAAVLVLTLIGIVALIVWFVQLVV